MEGDILLFLEDQVALVGPRYFRGSVQLDSIHMPLLHLRDDST